MWQTRVGAAVKFAKGYILREEMHRKGSSINAYVFLQLFKSVILHLSSSKSYPWNKSFNFTA